MLKVAGMSYAMENGSNEVKMLAKRIADTNTSDGVGKAIEEVLRENTKRMILCKKEHPKATG